MRKTLITLAIAGSLAGCGSTEALLAGAAVAGGFVSSITSSPDYNKYADTCRLIVQDAKDAALAESETLRVLATDKETKGQVLLYMALKPKTNPYAQCALALPKGFLQTLAESGNILNFVAAIYGENRADARAQRALQANKELGLAQMQHAEEMQAMENALLGGLAAGALRGVEAGAAAARPIVAPSE